MNTDLKVAILGGGLTGCCAALKLAKENKYKVSVYDKQSIPINAASLHNEGKLHLGYVYGADPDAETHKIMVHGSLSFSGVIEKLTGVKADTFTRSRPFIYAVPNDSQLSIKQQSEHFQRVDQCIDDIFHSGNEFYKSELPQTSHLLNTEEIKTSGLAIDSLQGALKTNEYSVNTTQVSNVVSASLLSNPMIDWQGKTEVVRAEKLQNGRYRIHFQQGERQFHEEFDAVINCLWEDRVRIDKTIGIEPSRPWLVRYKAAISGFSAKLQKKPENHPSLTLITGAYGDFVNHGNGHFYLSWYPKCKLGESQELVFPDIEKAVSTVNKKQLVKESFSAMAKYLPKLNSIQSSAENINVGGGYIFAWGSSDITDPTSGLHQRHLIGIEENDRWVSVNTGKYCTAPIFGVQASEKIDEKLSSTQK